MLFPFCISQLRIILFCTSLVISVVIQGLTWIKYGHQSFIFKVDCFLIAFSTFLKYFHGLIYTWGIPNIAVAQMSNIFDAACFDTWLFSFRILVISFMGKLYWGDVLEFLNSHYCEALITWATFYKQRKWEIEANLFMSFCKFLLQKLIFFQEITLSQTHILKPRQNTQTGDTQNGNLQIRTHVSKLHHTAFTISFPETLLFCFLWFLHDYVARSHIQPTSLALCLFGTMNTIQQGLDGLK